jgi:hypothetical protein
MCMRDTSLESLAGENPLPNPPGKGEGAKRDFLEYQPLLAKTTSLLLRLVSCLIVTSLLVISAPAAEPAAKFDQVQPATGPVFSGKLTSANAAGVLQFTLEGQTEPRSLKVQDLVRWGEWRKVQPGAQVLLHDRSFILADVLQVTPELLTVDSINGLGEIKLPRAAVRAIVLQPARWKAQPPAKTAAADTPPPSETAELLLANGDRRGGSLVGWDTDVVRWQTGEQTLRVPLGSVVAVEFRKPGGDLTEERSPAKNVQPQYWIGFSDGSRVLANSFAKDKTGWQIKLAAGGELTAETDALATLQTIHGRAVYLSDLTPAGYKSIPWLTTTWDYQRDRNVTGGELRVAGSLALKGLGMHSASRLTYDLDKKYERFTARVGIDDSTEGRGHATAKVYGDQGDGKWELLHETSALDGGTSAAAIDVDVRHLQRLALVVDFAGDGDAGDHVDWLDARLIRQPD